MLLASGGQLPASTRSLCEGLLATCPPLRRARIELDVEAWLKMIPAAPKAPGRPRC